MKPCPHCCNKHSPRVQTLPPGLSAKFVVTCRNCHTRGPLAIHAAKRPINLSEWNTTINKALYDHGYEHKYLPYGVIVCTVNLIDCMSTEAALLLPNFGADERYFGNYAPGRFAWQLDNVQVVDNIRARGSQGFWEWVP